MTALQDEYSMLVILWFGQYAVIAFLLLALPLLAARISPAATLCSTLPIMLYLSVLHLCTPSTLPLSAGPRQVPLDSGGSPGRNLLQESDREAAK